MAIYHAEYKLSGKLYTLRNAEPEDAAQMVSLLRRIDEQTIYLLREPGEFSMTVDQERAFLLERKRSAHVLMLVAETAGRIVGCAHAERGTLARTKHAARIGIALDKSCWGQGLGRAILESLLSWLRDLGVEKVDLTVDTQNQRAISLYMRLGFSISGHDRHERKMADGTYRDAYAMTLLLND